MLALGRRALSVQFRRAQLLMPTFVLPLMLLAVIASGTSAAQGLRGFPDVASYLAFVVPGTIIQGALLAGLTSGIALAADIEFGFFDRLLAAPVRRTSLVLGRQAGTLGLSVLQSVFFLAVALAFGARYPGGVGAALAAIVLAAITAVGIGGIAAAIALRTGSLSLLQSIFPFVFVLLFTAPAFFPRELLDAGAARRRGLQPADLRGRGGARAARRRRRARRPAGRGSRRPRCSRSRRPPWRRSRSPSACALT